MDDRSRRVLDPGYASDLEDRSLDQLRAMRDECVELETEASYVRRVAQGHLDILDAELDRRARGGSLEDLIRSLPRILADAGPRPDPVASRLAIPMAPAEDSEWTPRLAELDARLANLPDLDADGIEAARGDLRELEHEVSARRRALHTVLDRLEAALTQRHRTTT